MAARTERLLVAAVLALALALRLWGLGFGLPDAYHKDEIAIVRRALAFGTGDLNPHSFHWPAFHLYVLFFLYGVMYLGGAAIGAFHSVSDYRNLYFSDPTAFYLAGRLLSACFGTATVYLVYRVGSRLDDRRAGLFAALCLALTYYHVRDSHLASLDVPLTFWVTVAFSIAAKILLDPAPGAVWYAAAGVACGLATATKYNGGVAFLAVVAAHGLRRPIPSHRLLLGTAAIAVGTFCAATPYNWIDGRAFLRDFTFQQRHIEEGQMGLSTEPAWRYYLRLITFVHLKNARRSIFDPMTVLFGAGVIGALFHPRRREAALVLVVPVAYLLYIGRWGMAATRYLDPIFPMLALLAGSFLSRLRGPLLVLAGLTLALSLRTAVMSDFVLSQPDSRTEARLWIESHIAPDTRIALDADGPKLRPSPTSLEERYRGLASGTLRHPTQTTERMRVFLDWMKENAPRESYDLVYLNDTLLDFEASAQNRVPQTNWNLARLRALGVRYVITTSIARREFQSDRAERLYPRIAEFFRELDREPVWKEFVPSPWQPGPVIQIRFLEASP